eukprot:SM000069S20716  [mRNA]  locus=s69:386081:388511:- [translate_table: standard]
MGGSWGATLALAYAQAWPARVAGIILRGVCTLRQREVDWFYKQGASTLFPFGWEQLVSHLELEERGNIVAAYHRRLTSEDAAVQLAAAQAWLRWEFSLSSFSSAPFVYSWDGASYSTVPSPKLNRGFLREGQLLEEVSKIRHIPAIIVQGRYDFVCPIANAFDLHRAWPEAQLRVVPNAGHSMYEPGIVHELVTATEGFKKVDY